MKNLGTVLIGLIAALLLLSLSAFSVDQREYALVFRLGEIVSVKKEPGLYFKVPLVDNVRYFDKRILTLNWVEPDRFLTSEKMNVLVDSFIKWRIVDPAKYYVSVKGDELQAERRLSQTVNDGLRAEFGKRTIHEVVSGERSQIMDILRERADRDSRQMGIQVLDVRLRRVTCRKKLVSLYISVWKQSVSVWPMNAVRLVPVKLKKSVRMPISSVKSLLLKHSAKRKKSRVRAMPKLQKSILRLIARILSSMPFTAAWMLTATASRARAM